MSTITVTETAVPIIKSSLRLRQKLLRLKLQTYNKRLRALEKEHKVSSPRFLKQLKSGMIKDDAYIVEWEYLIETCQSLKNQLNQLQQVKI